MPRPRYQIADADVAVVHRWIRARFRENTWPEDWPHLTAWDKFPLDKPTAKQLCTWCARFLDTAQWKQLHAVIRAARRDSSQSHTVRLSTKAYAVLHQLAQREKLTLSATGFTTFKSARKFSRTLGSERMAWRGRRTTRSRLRLQGNAALGDAPVLTSSSRRAWISSRPPRADNRRRSDVAGQA